MDIVKKRAAGMKHSQVCYMPSRADTYVVAFQRWLSEFGNGGPFGPINDAYLEKMGPRKGREELLDRYNHTKLQNCAQCQGGLALARKALAAFSVASTLAMALAIICASIALSNTSIDSVAAAASSLTAAPSAVHLSPSAVAAAASSLTAAPSAVAAAAASLTAAPSAVAAAAASLTPALSTAELPHPAAPPAG
eukprot:gene14137-20099_t